MPGYQGDSSGVDIPGHHLRAGPDDRPDRSGAESPVLQVQQAEGQVREGD